jgi:hypothetical protein
MRWLIGLLCFVFAGCSNAPTGPSRTGPTAVNLLCVSVQVNLQCTLTQVDHSEPPVASVDVTARAQWTVSNPSIATVSTTGLLESSDKASWILLRAMPTTRRRCGDSEQGVAAKATGRNHPGGDCPVPSRNRHHPLRRCALRRDSMPSIYQNENARGRAPDIAELGPQLSGSRLHPSCPPVPQRLACSHHTGIVGVTPPT